MNAKFLANEQAAINEVRKNCTQEDLNSWFDQSHVKARFKKACMQVQKLRCCYCQKLAESTNNNHWDLEHILCEEGYPQFFATDDNLAVACKRCNGAKGSQDVLLPKPTLGHRLPYLPMDSECYAIPHPRIDIWADFLSHVNYQIYKAEKEKGLALIRVCKLNEPAIKHAGLSYESVVAATRKDFFAVMGGEVPETLADQEVIDRMARLTEGPENRRRDMMLAPLAKTLKGLERKSLKFAPLDAVNEARKIAELRRIEEGKAVGKLKAAMIEEASLGILELPRLAVSLDSMKDAKGVKQLLLEHKPLVENSGCD